MFEFSNDEDGMTFRVTGEAAEAISEIAKTLELNDHWPIMPLALENLYYMCQVHEKTGEQLRDVVMLAADEKKGAFLFDIEGMKIDAKRMEIDGLGDVK